MIDFSTDEEEDLLLLALVEDEERKKRDAKKSRKWIHDINKDRLLYGDFHTLIPQLRQDEKSFYQYFRMTSVCFDEILELIKDEIYKQDTNYREAICPEERLAIALRFLATGASYSTIGHSYRVGSSTVSRIVREVCDAICQKMQLMYMPEPTKEIWKKSAENFYNLWQFPNCIGSIEGKHIRIKCPSNSYSNFKKSSIVLVAIVGADNKFLCVDVGDFGNNSNEGIFEQSWMWKRFVAGSMNVPADKNLPGTEDPVPHVLLGDKAFKLKSTLMNPYWVSRHSIAKDAYNRRLCRARRVVENTFGILAQKFRIFYRPIETSVESAIAIVKTACILHNFLRIKKSDDLYFPHLLPPEPTLGAFRSIESDTRRATAEAFEIRKKFVNYFSNEI